MESTTATWHISLDCQCPYCNEYQDIYVDNCERDWIVNVGETKDLKTEGEYPSFSINCKKCDKEFCISRTEY